MTATAAAVRTRDVGVGEHRLRVHETGEPGAPAILLLHGSGPGATGLSNWAGVLGDLGADHHCIAPDILGFGDSSHPDDPPVGVGPYAELRAQTLLGLVATLGLSDLTVVGNSMGGMITLRMLAADPAPIAKVVLMASGGAPVAPTPDLMKLVLFYEDPTAEAMASLLTSFVSDPAFFGGELDAVAAARMPMARRDDVRRSHVATFTPVDAQAVDLDAVARIAQPVLLIHGREDRLIPLAAAHWFEEHIDRAQLHVLGHCGHWVQIEQRDRFVFLLRSFVAGSL